LVNYRVVKSNQNRCGGVVGEWLKEERLPFGSPLGVRGEKQDAAQTALKTLLYLIMKH